LRVAKLKIAMQYREITLYTINTERVRHNAETQYKSRENE